VQQYDEAIDEAQKSLELNSDFPVGLYVLGAAYAAKGMYKEAIAAHQRVYTVSPRWRFALGITYALTGRRDEALEVAAELEAEPKTWDTLFLAQIYSVLGEKDEAFRWLEEAYEEPHHPYMPWFVRMIAFEPLRDDPRFKDLLQRMNLPQLDESP